MYQIVIASHGPMANAMKESLQFFFKNLENVHTVVIDKDGISKFSSSVNNLLNQLKQEEVLVFVDLFYGTPFNEFARQGVILEKDFDIIAGINMASLMEAVSYQEQEKKLSEVLTMIIDAGKVHSFKEILATQKITEDDE